MKDGGRGRHPSSFILHPLSFVVVVLALALAPALSSAHVDRTWPSIQSNQPLREVDLQLSGTRATMVMSLAQDPARHGIVLEIDPAALWRAEYRVDPPDPATAFGVAFGWTRLVEYKDLNDDGKLSPGSDTIVRGWRLDAYRWNVSPITTAFVDQLEVQTMTWTGTIATGPTLKLQIAVAGRDFSDEGARARPQDVLLYLDVQGLPKRGTGNLHAFEGTMVFPAGANFGVYRTQGVDSAFMVELPRRQAHFVWGGSAVLDGREQAVNGTIDDPERGDDRWTSAWRLDMPITERAMRFVITFGVEYNLENKRAPDAGVLGVVASLVAVGLVARRASRED